mgnify:FL=1
MQFRKTVALLTLVVASGCATDSAVPTRAIPCEALSPFVYRDNDSERTRAWGDYYNLAWVRVCDGS